MKPVLVGYQCVRLDTSAEQVSRGRRLLAQFAAEEGYALGEVYVDRNVNRPCSALAALIAFVQRGGVAAIAAATYEDLGRLPRVRQLTWARLQRETGLLVLVAERATAGQASGAGVGFRGTPS